MDYSIVVKGLTQTDINNSQRSIVLSTKPVIVVCLGVLCDRFLVERIHMGIANTQELRLSETVKPLGFLYVGCIESDIGD